MFIYVYIVIQVNTDNYIIIKECYVLRYNVYKCLYCLYFFIFNLGLNPCSISRYNIVNQCLYLFIMFINFYRALIIHWSLILIVLTKIQILRMFINVYNIYFLLEFVGICGYNLGGVLLKKVIKNKTK